MGGHDKVNILLVDDLPSKLLSYEVILGELRENLILAGSAREALEHLLRTEVAVIVTDVSMPDLDGFELAAMIREHPRFQRMAIIFVSGIHLTDVDFLRGYQAGAVDYVSVPVIPDVLRAKVRVFVELYRKTRQLELMNSELEQRVAQRTAELAKANAELELRVEERTREREAALAKVHEMHKMESIGQLTGGVAHDFNNLLMVVLNNLNLLRKRVPADPSTGKLIDGALASAERGAALTKRMLAFARRQELKPEAIDVGELIAGIAEMFRQSAGPTIELGLALSADPLTINVDRNQLELALLNLVLNARDAMPGGGELQITTGREAQSAGAWAFISVRDSGCGMDEATLKRATEPFYTTKGVGKGTGLGLSMVHGLVVQSGGAFRISSEVDRGTTVQLCFPIVAHRGTASAPFSRVSLPQEARWRILLVDDDPLVLGGTAAMLEDAGHEIVEANSAKLALDALGAGEAFDVVITDQIMPMMTGVELATEIAANWPNLPVILASGYADTLSMSLELPRLNKPYSQDDLISLVSAVIDTRGREPAGVRAKPGDDSASAIAESP
jgi:signal transduction histidine kinase